MEVPEDPTFRCAKDMAPDRSRRAVGYWAGPGAQGFAGFAAALASGVVLRCDLTR